MVEKSQKQKDAEWTAQWRQHAYPLKQLVITVQGNRFTDREWLVKFLNDAVAEFQAGNDFGKSFDDDEGYLFDYRSDVKLSIFDYQVVQDFVSLARLYKQNQLQALWAGEQIGKLYQDNLRLLEKTADFDQ